MIEIIKTQNEDNKQNNTTIGNNENNNETDKKIDTNNKKKNTKDNSKEDKNNNNKVKNNDFNKNKDTKDNNKEKNKNKLEIIKISNNSNIYIIKNLNIVIDAGLYEERNIIEKEIKKVINPDKIETVILTHLHYDHIGCFELFKNAKFYASPLGIKSLKEDKENTILNPQIANIFNVKLEDISQLKLPKNFEIILTPGHSIGSLCIYEKENKILFSGDTIFNNGGIGRYDLPTSNYEELTNSLTKLSKYNIEILCSGHDY